ncbi:hypothetical protein SCHPADRAFT_155056 [Schizopora paradoxa]|uniref:Uncharacterized protein n=1 Tax=Schizopora paradoxa TaxID=27342 RepID=A0A0H2SKQ2_9AGAM|nr:hypothetical protein SCHPADRAFT_155056 [Schizopora paradoxa]
MGTERYNLNNLTQVKIDEVSLESVMSDLESAIRHGVTVIHDNSPPQGRSDKHDSLYTGDSGIGLMFIRLSQGNGVEWNKCARTYLPKLHVHHPRAGRLSSLDSAVGPAVAYVLIALGSPSESVVGCEECRRDWDAAIRTIRNVVNVAINDKNLGGDEVLYGKTGLLWAMLNFHYLSGKFQDRTGERTAGDRNKYTSIQEIQEIPGTAEINSVYKAVLRSGAIEAQDFKERHESAKELALPLMWSWHGKYYLGAWNIDCPPSSALGTWSFLTLNSSFPVSQLYAF